MFYLAIYPLEKGALFLFILQRTGDELFPIILSKCPHHVFGWLKPTEASCVQDICANRWPQVEVGLSFESLQLGFKHTSLLRQEEASLKIRQPRAVEFFARDTMTQKRSNIRIIQRRLWSSCVRKAWGSCLRKAGDFHSCLRDLEGCN